MLLRSCAVGLATCALVSALPASLALAAPPVPDASSITDEVVLADCGSFDLIDRFTLNSQGKVFLDGDGNVIRVVEHVWGSDTFVNSVTGESLTGTISAGETVDLVAGTVTESGQVGRITVPGVGVLFFDVGKFIVDFDTGEIVFRAGRHHAFLDSEYAALCAALS